MLNAEQCRRDAVSGDQRRRNKAWVVAGAVAGVLVLGIGGYYLLGGGAWSVMTCAYMTVVTLSTVGFGEVIPITGHPVREGFTIVLLLIGMGTMFYAVTTLSTFLIEGAMFDTVRRRRMSKALSRITGHYIVCGAGRSGGVTIHELIEGGHQVVAIDMNEELLARLAQRCGPGLIPIIGDATEDEVLELARAGTAAGLVAALSEDRDNMYVTVSARQLNPELRIVSKSLNDPKKIQRAGADAVVWINAIGGHRLYRELVCPRESHLLEELLDPAAMSVAEVEVEAGSCFVGLRLGADALRDETKVLIAALRCPKSGRCLQNPDRSTVITAGAKLIVMGGLPELERFRTLARSAPERALRTSLRQMMVSSLPPAG